MSGNCNCNCKWCISSNYGSFCSTLFSFIDNKKQDLRGHYYGSVCLFVRSFVRSFVRPLEFLCSSQSSQLFRDCVPSHLLWMKVCLHNINEYPKTNQGNWSFIGEEEEEIKVAPWPTTIMRQQPYKHAMACLLNFSLNHQMNLFYQ